MAQTHCRLCHGASYKVYVFTFAIETLPIEFTAQAEFSFSLTQACNDGISIVFLAPTSVRVWLALVKALARVLVLRLVSLRNYNPQTIKELGKV